MNRRLTKINTMLILIFIIAVIVLFKKDYLMYRYYMWRISSGEQPIYLIDSIERISTNVLPLLTKTFEDEEANPENRLAATYGIIKADKEAAKRLFLKHLKSGNDDQIANAILGLYELEYTESLADVIAFAESKNPEIRASVARYLALFPVEESIRILERLVNDTDSTVRFFADTSLRALGASTHNSRVTVK